MVMEMTDRSVPSIGAEADVVGQRLSLRIGKTDCPGMVIAYFPKTQKHRIRFECESGREKNFRLETMTYKWVTDRSKSSLPAYDLAIRRDAVGRRLEIFHQVRQKWYRATVLRYVEHCQHHALLLEPQGKVHLVDLTEQAWRFTDLIGAPQQPQTPLDATLPPSSLATSKYMGVLRFTESTWKACYEPQQLYIGCFGSEKDAALAYDVYARKRGSLVNFEDRRICRKGIKSLLVPEPKVVPEVTSSTPDVVVPAATTPEDAESTHTDAPPLLEEKHSVEESDATPSLEVEETESTLDQVEKVVVEEEVVSAAVPSEAKALKEKREKKEKTSKVKKEVPKEKKEKVVVEEKAEVTDDDHPVIDMTASEDLPERPELVVRRRISVEDDDEEEEPVRRISVEEPRLPSAKEAATAIQEDSEFEFGDGEEEEEEEESEESSDEEDVIVRPRKRGRPKKKQKEKAETESEESSDEREAKIPRKRGRPKKKHQKKASESEESSDEEELIVPRKRGRPKKKKHTKEALANLFDSSEDEEEELERRIARKLKKKGRSALLEELADHNTPPLGEQSEKKKKKRRKEKLTKRGRSILPVGTRFLKEFPDFGTFEGRITEWDGNHYFVYYSEDEDQEELSDYEFDNYEILSVPKKDALMDVSIRKSKKKKKRRREKDFTQGMT